MGEATASPMRNSVAENRLRSFEGHGLRTNPLRAVPSSDEARVTSIQDGVLLMFMLLFLSTFEAHRRAWAALARRMRMLRLNHKPREMQALRVN
jgi:hypothetical protein